MTQMNLFHNDSMNTYLLTIREEPAKALMDGIKKHEFRRKFDNYNGKAKVFLYVTKPIGKIMGYVILDSPIIDSIDNLCLLLTQNKHDTEEGVRTYLNGCEVAYALPVINSKRFNKPISLEEMRKNNPGFNPPMSYIKLDKDKYCSIKEYLLNRD